MHSLCVVGGIVVIVGCFVYKFKGNFVFISSKARQGGGQPGWACWALGIRVYVQGVLPTSREYYYYYCFHFFAISPTDYY
jgi:hypothetical protein